MDVGYRFNRVFIKDEASGLPLMLPNNVFANLRYEYLFDFGGHFVESENEYIAIMTFLKSIGEESLYFTINGDRHICSFELPTDSILADFEKEVTRFSPNFGLLPYDVYIFGNMGKWGIFLSQNPSILIVGCEAVLKEDFKKLYSIEDNGFRKVRDFILQESGDNFLNSLEATYSTHL